MATTTHTKNGAPNLESAFEHVNEWNEQILTAARKAGRTYLDAYEKAVDRAIDVELKVAGLSQQEWLKSMIETQADITRELTSSYTTTARSLLK